MPLCCRTDSRHPVYLTWTVLKIWSVLGLPGQRLLTGPIGERTWRAVTHDVSFGRWQIVAVYCNRTALLCQQRSVDLQPMAKDAVLSIRGVRSSLR